MPRLSGDEINEDIVDVHHASPEKEVHPLGDILGADPSTLPSGTTDKLADNQDDATEAQQLRKQLDATKAELTRVKDQAAAKLAHAQKTIAAKDADLTRLTTDLTRASFCKRLEDHPLVSFDDLMQRVEALQLPLMDDVSPMEEPVEVIGTGTAYTMGATGTASTMGASVQSDKYLETVKFNYQWLTMEQRQQCPYLQMEIVDSAIDEVLLSHFFASDATTYNEFVESSATILRKLRAVVFYYLYDEDAPRKMGEHEHMTPMAWVFVKGLIDRLSLRGRDLTARVANPGDFLLSEDDGAEGNCERDALEKDQLTFRTTLFDHTTGRDVERDVTGYTDIAIVDVSDEASFRSIIELKLHGKLDPLSMQAAERGQMFAEMLGLQCRHPQRPLYVGILTDLFSLYVLLSSSTPTPPPMDQNQRNADATNVINASAVAIVNEPVASSLMATATTTATTTATADQLLRSSPIFISQTRSPLPSSLYVKYLLFALYCVDTERFPSETVVRPQLSRSAMGPTGGGTGDAGSGVPSVGHPGEGSRSHGDDTAPAMSSLSRYPCLDALPVVPFYDPPDSEIRFDVDSKEEVYEAMLKDALYFRRFNALIHGEPYLSEDALKQHQAQFERV